MLRFGEPKRRGEAKLEDVILITGGAGSLGRRLVKHLLTYSSMEVKAVRVLDTNENGLARLAQQIKDKRVRFLLGDIRNKERMKRAMENVTLCYHAAAQKHVDLAERNPFYSIDINVMGTQVCIEAALEAKVERFIMISSDKSVQACSTYGRCKALAERLTLDAEYYKGDNPTRFAVARPPNYINSDGSIFDLWRYQKKHGLPITVTSPDMHRYFMSIEEIIDFLVKCSLMMCGGEIFVPRNSQRLRIIDLAQKFSSNIQIIGLRPGEKLEEVLIDPTELQRAETLEDMWIIR